MAHQTADCLSCFVLFGWHHQLRSSLDKANAGDSRALLVRIEIGGGEIKAVQRCPAVVQS